MSRTVMTLNLRHRLAEICPEAAQSRAATPQTSQSNPQFCFKQDLQDQVSVCGGKWKLILVAWCQEDCMDPHISVTLAHCGFTWGSVTEHQCSSTQSRPLTNARFWIKRKYASLPQRHFRLYSCLCSMKQEWYLLAKCVKLKRIVVEGFTRDCLYNTTCLNVLLIWNFIYIKLYLLSFQACFLRRSWRQLFQNTDGKVVKPILFTGNSPDTSASDKDYYICHCTMYTNKADTDQSLKIIQLICSVTNDFKNTVF